jgi:hypothetical protein
VSSLPASSPIRVFISYAHADKNFRDRLDVHLANLKNQGVIDAWYDGDLLLGQEWEPIILRELNTADIILLLISPEFMASSFIYTKEFAQVMERHEAGEAVVIPVLLRPVDYISAPFARLSAVPLNAKKQLQPIATWRDKDVALVRVAEGVMRAIQRLRSAPSNFLGGALAGRPLGSSEGFAYDVFISYSLKDRDWVRGPLLQRLETHNLRVCIDFRDFRPGMPTTDEMERAVFTSRFALIVLTPDYLTSGWRKFEGLVRQTLSANPQEYRLIPLLKEPCEPPLIISYLTHVDFTDPQQESLNWHRLLTALDPPQAGMEVGIVPRIFISYRRDDSAGHAGRLYDQLSNHFGDQRIFMDTTGIDPGVDFVEAIQRSVSNCTVLLAVIGQHWISVVDSKGQRRIDDPHDFVRLEIATALERNIRIIPVLVHGATMPRALELPDELILLARRNAFEIRDTSFKEDVARLIPFIEKSIP